MGVQGVIPFPANASLRRRHSGVADFLKKWPTGKSACPTFRGQSVKCASLSRGFTGKQAEQKTPGLS